MEVLGYWLVKLLHVLCNTGVYCNIIFSVLLFVRQNTLTVRHTTAADRFLFKYRTVCRTATQTNHAGTRQRCMRDASLNVSLLWHNVTCHETGDSWLFHWSFNGKSDENPTERGAEFNYFLSYRDLRTRHAVVTGTDLSCFFLQIYTKKLMYHKNCWVISTSSNKTVIYCTAASCMRARNFSNLITNKLYPVQIECQSTGQTAWWYTALTQGRI